jgi:methylphosphotriester-DNA--protein-cysteine methyltransferase
MIKHSEIERAELLQKIKKREVGLGGNAKLKIYGMLNCTFGKRMKKQNRVFFVNETEALALGYRPCGHCMKTRYKKWKDGLI